MATATRRRRPMDDEGPEETPRRRRRPVDEDEEEQPRRRRPVPEDDKDVEEAPRSRRRRPEPEPEDDDDVEEAPRRRRSRSADDEEPPRRRRNSRAARDDEDDDRPRGRRAASSKRGGRVARGWSGYEKVKSASSDFEKKFKPTSEAQVVAVLEEDGPFATFARHWVDLDEGKRAFICPASLEPEDDDDELECPLCDVGDKPNAPRGYLNVAVLEPGRKPELAVWEIGPAISEQLQMIDKSIGRRTKLTEIYIEASSKGSGLNTKYFLEPLFEEDLDDLDVKPLTDKQRNGFELYDEGLYPIPTLKELNRVADEIA